MSGVITESIQLAMTNSVGNFFGGNIKLFHIKGVGSAQQFPAHYPLVVETSGQRSDRSCVVCSVVTP